MLGIMLKIIDKFLSKRTLCSFSILLGLFVSHAECATEELGGKPVSEWISQLKSDNRGLQVRAARALAEAPAELRPAIISQIIPLLKSERENDRFVAAQVLGEYGPSARVAVPELLPLLKGTQYERNRAAAAKALGQILKDAEPSEEVNKVAEALAAKFNEDYDPYSDVRREAVRAIGMIGPAARCVIPKLTRALTDYKKYSEEHQMVRQQAAWACGQMGPAAAEHMDRLISMLHAEGHEVPEIVEAIGKIGAINDNVVPNIIDKMEGSSYRWMSFHIAALKALQRFGAKSKPAVPYIIRILQERGTAHAGQFSLDWRIEAVKLLASIGAEAREALPLLEKLKNATIPGASKEGIEKFQVEVANAIKAISPSK
jgi:HEAT repeat protein